ncbi:MAG: hypothetical protein KGM99_10820, partial [Burkholderiales bacterium]|nr:hypothetical protein [Burkholderiales bacterium]
MNLPLRHLIRIAHRRPRAAARRLRHVFAIPDNLPLPECINGERDTHPGTTIRAVHQPEQRQQAVQLLLQLHTETTSF